MKFHGNVRGEVRVNFLALSASKPHIFMCGALKLSGIVRTNVRLNIAIPMLFWSLNLQNTGKCKGMPYILPIFLLVSKVRGLPILQMTKAFPEGPKIAKIQDLSGTESRIANRTIPRIAGLESPEILQREAKNRIESQ